MILLYQIEPNLGKSCKWGSRNVTIFAVQHDYIYSLRVIQTNALIFAVQHDYIYSLRVIQTNVYGT